MQKLILTSLTLSHFKGTEAFSLQPGALTRIYGANASGKTTVADAYFWLLFGKDSSNRKDFQIKTIVHEGLPELKQWSPAKMLHHTVEGSFSLEGESYTFFRDYHEQYGTTRSSKVQEFKGNTTDYRVNGVPVQEKEYLVQVGRLIDEKTFRLLSDPTYFNTVLKWEERRALLIQVCGDIKDEDVIAMHPAFADLPKILGRNTADQHKKVLAATRKATNDQIAQIPTRVDELKRQERPKVERLFAEGELSEQLKLVETLTSRVEQAKNGGEIAEKNRELLEVDNQILTERNRLTAEAGKVGEVERLRVNTLNNSLLRAQTVLDTTVSQIQSSRDELGRQETSIAALRIENNAIKARTFTFDGSDTCASCGQPLPAERVAEVRQRAEELFNTKKATEHEATLARGKQLKATIEDLKVAITELESQEAVQREAVSALKAQYDEAAAALDAIASPDAVAPTSDFLIKLRADKQVLQDQIAQLRLGDQAQVNELVRQKGEAQTKAQLAQTQLAQLGTWETTQERIAELGAEQKKLAKELERLDKELNLIEEFARTKASMLTERINECFTLAQFQLFETQINGGLIDTCKTTINGVQYEDLNTGSKLNVGLDIINTLAEHFGFAPPILIDNSESVTDILPTHGQQIQFVVSAPDTTLRVETA